MAERICARCHGPFITPEGAKGQASCWCRPCRNEYMREYKRTWTDPQATPCPGCGETMTRKSRQCGSCRLASTPKWVRTHRPCAGCGVLFWPASTNTRWCSTACNTRVRSAEYHARKRDRERELAPRQTGACAWCFTPIMSSSGHLDRRFCSARCSSARNAHWVTWKAPDRCHLPICIDCGNLGGFNPAGARKRCEQCQDNVEELRRNASEARRKKAERSGDATIHWTTVGERDLWMCHICNKKVPKRPGDAADMDGATVDHLIPIARDGTHTWANVAIAHRSCNLSRGTGGLTQLRLVG